MFSSNAMPWLNGHDIAAPESQHTPTHTLQWFLENSAETHPDRCALIVEGNPISYEMLNALSDSVAAGLHTTGFRQGDRAVIFMQNCPQFVISYYGILKAGGIVLTIDPACSIPDLHRQLRAGAAETVFVTSQYYKQLKSVQAGTRIQRIIVTSLQQYFPKRLQLRPSAFRERQLIDYAKRAHHDIAFVDFLKLGRKSGKPKLKIGADDTALVQRDDKSTDAAVSHRSLVAWVYAIQAALGDRSDSAEIVLADAPFFDYYGMIAIMHYSIMIAATVVLVPDLHDQAALLKSSRDNAISRYPSQPATVNAIVQQSERATEPLNTALPK